MKSSNVIFLVLVLAFGGAAFYMAVHGIGYWGWWLVVAILFSFGLMIDTTGPRNS